MSLQKVSNTFLIDSSSLLTFGTMLFNKEAQSIILKCNFCQKEIDKLNTFMIHMSKHIGGMKDSDINKAIEGLCTTANTSQQPFRQLKGESLENPPKMRQLASNENDDYLNELIEEENYEGEPSENSLDYWEEDYGEPTTMKTQETKEQPPGLGSAFSPIFDFDTQDSIIENEEENDYEDEVKMNSEDFDDFVDEEQNLEIEFCNEVYLKPLEEEAEVEEVETTSSKSQNKSQAKAEDKSFLSESGTGFEVEFLEAKQSAIKNHNINNGDKNGFICAICKKVCTSKAAYQAHLKRHSQAKVHTCEICQAVFKDVSNLKVHRNRHLRVQPYPCDLCDKAFTTTTERKIHKRSHTGEKPYVCDYCGASYSTASHLKSHSYRHLQIRRHKCTICDKAYFIKEELRCHMRTHTNERPYACELCDKRFSRVKIYKQHMDLHSSEKKFKCPCGKMFAQGAGLYLHKKSCKHLI